MKKSLVTSRFMTICILIIIVSFIGTSCGPMCFIKDSKYSRDGNKQGKCSSNGEDVKCSQIYIQGQKNWSCQRYNMQGEKVKSGWSPSYSESLRNACECE